ncbi:GIY-YIG nuclease family protein [Echinicola sediminis]
MGFYFYILFSVSSDRYYIGHTSGSLEERLRRHNSNHKGITGKQCDWEMVYWEEYPSKSLAHARERSVKKWKSRKRIEGLIGTS